MRARGLPLAHSFCRALYAQREDAVAEGAQGALVTLGEDDGDAASLALDDRLSTGAGA